MAVDDEPTQAHAALIPISSFRLIPVGLKEAALDSPTFRATVVHFSDQVEGIEKWLDGVVKHATRLAQEASVLDSLMTAFFTHAAAPNHLSEAVLDHDYTLRAMHMFNHGGKEFLGHTTSTLKGMQSSVVDPLRSFIQSEIRPYREAKRHLDQTQRNYDSILLRYQGQGKNKEPSSLREDAFQLHEARKAYLKASMDVCVLGPQLRLALDSLLIQVFSDQWLKIRDFAIGSTDNAQKLSREMTRIRGWSKDLSQNERVLRRELLLARKDIEQGTESAARPPRELDTYAVSTVPYLGSRPAAAEDLAKQTRLPSKQGWLLQRSISGKPARTTWLRRWFFVRNGIFGYLLQDANSGGVEESEKIGVLLCGVRPAFQEERRFCFEVKTKDTSMMLQAETQAELTDWIAIFEIAKRQAIEQPSTTELLANSGTDAAFAVSPATAPELAIKHTDNEKDEPLGLLTAEPDTIGGSPYRNSIDVSSLRRNTADSNGESSKRDHAARIIEKLDLHRKSSAVPQVSKGNLQPPGGGIASLIAASHGSLGLQGVRSPVRQGSESRQNSSSLAPDTLAMPPQPTALSKTAIMVGMERRHTLVSADTSNGGLPGGLLANHWGAANYGYTSRLERSDQGSSGTRSRTQSIAQTAQSPTGDRVSPVPPSEEQSQASLDSPQRGSPVAVSPHRKTLSTSDARLEQMDTIMDLPKFYPPSLRAHDAQFRLLFPDVSSEERVVLVSRLSWSLSDTQDLPGRVYFTQKGCYFYSHHLGLVLVVKAELEAMIDLSTVPYQDYDLMNITMRGQREREEPYVVTAKSFLEPIRLLKRRINYLVNNANAEEPDDLEEILRHLISLERAQVGRSGSPTASESWEDLGLENNDGSPVRKREVQVRVDRMHGDSGFADINEPTRLRLPPQPVNHIPAGCSNLATEQIYDVSAKALFHIMFGDSSAIFQMLYRERRASNVRQSPWQMDNAFHRSFTYDVSFQDALKREQTSTVTDTQIVEVSNDHLCYVVSDERSPWHLPYPDQFRLTSKIVITHYSKSRARLAIWTGVRWANRAPPLTRNMIERHALDDLHIDAVATQNLVADQISRLGPGFTTKRAVQAFGHIGRQTDVAAITVSADTLPPSILGSPQRISIRKQTLIGLMWESFRSLAVSAASTVVMSAIGLAKAMFKAFSAHTILLALVLTLASIQLLATRNLTVQWWHDRAAVKYMARLGVGPDVVMARAVFLRDIPQIAASTIDMHEWSTAGANASDVGGKCARAFHTILQATDASFQYSAAADDAEAVAMNASQGASIPSPAAQAISDRLSRARLRLSTRRHDLLVGLRLVNRIERETVRAEYEQWLLAEEAKCAQTGRVLARIASSRNIKKAEGSGDDNDPESRLEMELRRRMGGDQLERVKLWYNDYCESCRIEKGQILGRGM